MRITMETRQDKAGEMVVREADTPATLTTTLYALVAAVQDVVGSNNDTLVVATVQDMLRSNHATWAKGVVAHGNRRPDPRPGRRLPRAVFA